MRTWIARLFDRKVAPPSSRRPRRRFRPGCEALEARDVPAHFYWVGGADPNAYPSYDPVDVPINARIAYNWTDDDFPAQRSPICPGNGDIVYFNVSDMGQNVDCKFFGDAGQYAAVLVEGGYGKTITLSKGFTTSTFDLNATPDAKVDQVGNDITVTATFNMTNGTLNVAGHLANVKLDGATGTIAPANEGTVKLGSSIIETSGAVLTRKAGTIEVNNDEQEFDIGENCGIEVDPGAGTARIDKSSSVVTGPLTYIHPNSFLRLLSGTSQDKWAVRNDGEFTLMPGTTWHLTGEMTIPGPAGPAWPYRTIPPPPGYDLSPVSRTYVQTGGVTRLYNGSTLQVSKPMEIQGGKLSTLVGETETATIRGNLEVSGGDVVIGDGSIPHVYGTLLVDGDVIWTGGTYRPVVMGQEDTLPPEFVRQSDRWQITGTLTVGGSATIAPGTVDSGGYQIDLPEVAGNRWLVIQADRGITIQAGSNAPSIIGPWALAPDNSTNPVRFWYITSTYGSHY